MTFWPPEITAEKVESPAEILRKIGCELTERVSFLECKITISDQDDRRVLGFEITNSDNHRVLRLLEVVVSLKYNYPCSINPPTLELPSYLMRKRVIPASAGMLGGGIALAINAAAIGALGPTPEKTVENEWICASPGEFSRKMEIILSGDAVKCQLLNLMTTTDLHLGDNGA